MSNLLPPIHGCRFIALCPYRELGDWLYELYPSTQNLFLYRHAETYLKSSMQAYITGAHQTAEEQRAMEKEVREYFRPNPLSH